MNIKNIKLLLLISLTGNQYESSEFFQNCQDFIQKYQTVSLLTLGIGTGLMYLYKQLKVKNKIISIKNYHYLRNKEIFRQTYLNLQEEKLTSNFQKYSHENSYEDTQLKNLGHI